MFKITFVCLLWAVCLAEPNPQQYLTPTKHFDVSSGSSSFPRATSNQFSRGNFNERISDSSSGGKFNEEGFNSKISIGGSSRLGSTQHFGLGLEHGSDEEFRHRSDESHKHGFEEKFRHSSGLDQDSNEGFKHKSGENLRQDIGVSFRPSSKLGFEQHSNKGFTRSSGENLRHGSRFAQESKENFGHSSGLRFRQDSDENFRRGSQLGFRTGSDENFRQTSALEFTQNSGAGFPRRFGQISKEDSEIRFGLDSGERFKQRAESGLRKFKPTKVYSNDGSRRKLSNRFDSINRPAGPAIDVVQHIRKDSEDGSHYFGFESEDGIQREESVSLTGPDGSVVQQGSWSYTHPDGTPAKFNFVADANGFQVESDLIPPLPDHAVAQLERAERDRADGIFDDGQYRAEHHLGSGSTFRGSSGSLVRGGQEPDSSSGERRSLGSVSRIGSYPSSSSSFGRSDTRGGFRPTSLSLSGRRRESGGSLFDNDGFHSGSSGGGGRFQSSRRAYDS